jgi:hypothetical protein
MTSCSRAAERHHIDYQNPRPGIGGIDLDDSMAVFGASAFIKLPSDNQSRRSYKIEEEAAVFGLVRFWAQIVPKCFT